MTKENKELLLRGLCARLPYGVIIEYNNDGCSSTRELGLGSLHDFMFDNAELKPYLRPMSSMTKEEVLEYISLKESIVASDGITYFFETYKSIDWLNKKMFDYRKDDEGKTMIEKGLALEAPEGMYK